MIYISDSFWLLGLIFLFNGMPKKCKNKEKKKDLHELPRRKIIKSRTTVLFIGINPRSERFELTHVYSSLKLEVLETSMLGTGIKVRCIGDCMI